MPTGRSEVLLWNGIVAAAYVATGVLSLRLADLHPSVTLVWVPSGVATAALFLGGRRLVPGVALGAFLVSATSGAPFAFWVVTAVGNPLGAMAAAFLLKHVLAIRPQLDRVRDVLAFLLAGAIAPTTLSAACGTGGMVLLGMASPGDAAEIFERWWLGDAVGVAVVGALLLTWVSHGTRFRATQLAEMVAIFALAAFCFAEATAPSRPPSTSALFGAALVPLALWTTFRYGPRGATASTCAAGAMILYGVATRAGVFATTTPEGAVFIGWAYLSMTAVSSLLLAATVAEAERRALDVRRALDAVERSISINAELAALVDSSTDLVFATGLDTTIKSWNPAAERTTGYAAEEILGRSVAELIPPEENEIVGSVLERVLAGERVDALDVVGVRKDGSTFQAQISVGPILDDAGNVVGASNIARDVTDQERLKERLAQAEKLEAVGTLAGGIAHDFNNLLWVILGNTERAVMKLPDTEENQPARTVLQDVVAAAVRAKELVERILAFTRAQPRESEVVSLREIVEESLPLVRPMMPPGIELHVDLAGTDDGVLADPGQLRQVVTNLCGNAITALGESGDLHIAVRPIEIEEPATEDVPPGFYVLLEVRDTGCGMDPATRKRIFEPFFTTKHPGGGTGLGLATVHRIVASRGGVIRVDSAEGEGTTFRVFLPRANVAAVRADETASELAAGGGESLLVVDDEEHVLATLGGLLSDLGYDVTQCREPEQAVALIEAEPQRFQLVITDQAMPGLTGRQLIERAREHAPELPAILVSGFGPAAAEVAGFRCLQKPVHVDELARTIRAALAS